MASKVRELIKVIGNYNYKPGSHMYHANDGVRDGGTYSSEKRHRLRTALHKLRLRASGMTDDLMGSKETQGSLDNPYEKSPPRE